MRPISTRELLWLLGPHTPPCISIYVPAGRQVDPVADVRRYEARLAEAEALLARALVPAECEKLLAPLRQLAAADLWQRRKDALAVFRSRDLFTHYRIPAQVPELTVVSETFHSRPLVRYLNSNRRHFYVLAFAPDALRLHEGSLDRITPVDPEEMPPELAAALLDERGRAHLSVDATGGGGRARGKRSQNGHGHEGLARWFRAIDRALWAWLKDDLAPLILAGAPQHHAAFRAASRYPELLDEGIEQDVTAMDRAELHLRALELIRTRDADVLGALLAQLSSALATGAGDTDLQSIARAAAAGRVRILMFTADAQQWGRLDRRTGALTIEERQSDAVDADVVDDLCELVLLAGGDVHEVPEGALPAPIAAIYRR